MAVQQSFDDVRRDVRDGFRTLVKRPAFTAVAVLSLALGIGANTAIFSLVNAIILRESPVDRPEEVVNLYLHQASFAYSTFSYPDYEDVRDGTTEVFSQVGGSQFVPVQIDQNETVAVVMAEAVTGNYFPMLGIEAAVGRTLLPSDDVARGGHPVVMLDHSYWQSAFGGDPDVVGTEMRIAGRTYSVIGVGPPSFAGTMSGLTPAFYAPYMMVEELIGSSMFDERGNHSMFPKARLRPGVTLPQAEAAMGAVATQLTEDRIENWDPAGQFVLLRLSDVLMFPPIDVFIRGAAWLLMVVVGLVLFLACTNLASFLLARALDRRKDIAVRLALGASRASLVRRLLTETTLLSLVAGGVGIVIAVGLLNLLMNADFPLPLGMQLTFDLGLDRTVLAFTLGVSVVAGALLGLVPALQSTRPDVASTLKSETTGGGQPGQLRWRNALVITQLTVSLVLLVGAGLFLRSFQQAQLVDPGFGREPTALMTFMVPATRFTPDEGRLYTRRLLDRFRGLPGIDAIGFIDNLHLTTTSTQSSDFNVDGHEPPSDHGAFIADRAEVDAGFFDAAGIQIVRGRGFNDADLPDSQPVAIISDAMARRFWKDGDAVGRQVRRRRSAAAGRRGGERREGADARRGAAQHDLPSLFASVRALGDGGRADLGRSGADGARADRRRPRGRPRSSGLGSEDDGPASGAHAAAAAALRLRSLRLRSLGVRGPGPRAGGHRPLRCGQLCGRPTDARGGDPDGARRRQRHRDSPDGIHRTAPRRGRQRDRSACGVCRDALAERPLVRR